MVEVLRRVGMLEAKGRFSEICGDVAQTGESVILCRRGQPLVELRPVREVTITIDAEVDEPCPVGILDCLRDCEERFGPLESDFTLPRHQ